MRSGRLFRLLLLALPVVLGLAEGADHHPSAVSDALNTISAPRESLPQPVHDEATCAFCQAAIFPPCASQPAAMSVEPAALVRREAAAPAPSVPHFVSHRPASSRAPPDLPSV